MHLLVADGGYDMIFSLTFLLIVTKCINRRCDHYTQMSSIIQEVASYVFSVQIRYDMSLWAHLVSYFKGLLG
jgi:hypothetical protein